MSSSSGERPLPRMVTKRCNVSNQNGAPSDAANPVKNQPRNALTRCAGSRRYCHCDWLHPIGRLKLLRLLIAKLALSTNWLRLCVASSIGVGSTDGAVPALLLSCDGTALTVLTAWLTVAA